MEDTEIISQCNDFLSKSCKRYSSTLKRAAEDLELYSGEFWTDKMKQDYRAAKSHQVFLSLNNWNVICNAIASPMSASPWHTELKKKDEDELKSIQESIDQVEARNDVKTSLLDAFRKAVLTGYGFVVISTDIDEFTGEPTIVLEAVKHPQSVALDPCINTVDGSDAEEGALVNFIGVRKAKRLYGDDVVPMQYPETQGLLNMVGLSQWTCPVDQVPIVSYYVKEDQGVHFYKICCNKVVQSTVLPIKYIPIVRISGNEIFEKEQVNYNGIVQQTMSLELGANIAYSTLIERCGRSVKAGYLINVDAIDGLESYYAKMGSDESAVVLWKGEHQPVPLEEHFQTGDLQATVTTCRTLLEDVVGVPLTGIPSGTPEKTATEILRQQVSKESNTASYYNNAFTACRTISKVFIEMLTGGYDLEFTLENGPSVITRQMKARQELTALATICPDELKPVIAKFFADTLEDDVGKELSRNIVANMPKDVMFISDDSIDPLAIHQLEQMKATVDATMMELDNALAQNKELQQQLDTAQMSLMDSREARIQDWNKFIVSEQDKMALESAKLEQAGAKDADKLQIDAAKVELEAERDIDKSQSDTNNFYLAMHRQAGEEQRANRESAREDAEAQFGR